MSKYNLNKARVGGGVASTKLPPGQYRVRIEKCFMKESEDRKRARTEYFICEFTVKQVSNGGESFTDKHGNEYPTTKEGDYRSWSNNMAHANAPGSLNEFLCAVDGVDPRDPVAIKEANLDFDRLFDDALDSKNPMRGAEIDVRVVCKQTEGGNHFMQHTFSVAT